MTSKQRRLLVTCLAGTLVLPGGLAAQGRPRRSPEGGPGFLFHVPRFSVGVRGGFNLRPARSEIYDFVTDELTLSRSDFSAFSVAGDVGVVVAGPVDLVLSGGFTRTSAPSEFRNYDEDGLPITQRTALSTVPLTAALRWNFASRGRSVGRFVWIPARVVPYVGAGVGTIWYRFEQAGSFVDFQDLSIFSDRLTSEDWAPLFVVMAGADYSLGRRVFLNADVRYFGANAELVGDFFGYDDGIDLSGVQFSLGLAARI
jgi:hypothetical protein